MADIHGQQDKQTGNGAAEVIRRGAAAARTTAEVVRQSSDVVGQAGATAEETQRTTRSLWAGSQDMWRMLPGQGAPPGSMPEMSLGFGALFGDIFRTNLKIGQEFFRLANPMPMIEIQQKLVRSYLDAIVAGQSMLLGAARETVRRQDADVEAIPERLKTRKASQA